jgi:hypothetical protein
MRTLAMPKTAEPWSLTSLREKLIKIGAKVVSHGRYVTFQMAEVAVPRQTFQEILSLIAVAEVRLDAGRAERFSASVRTGDFDRLPRTRGAICRCSRRSKRRSWPRNDPESGECPLNGSQSRRACRSRLVQFG